MKTRRSLPASASLVAVAVALGACGAETPFLTDAHAERAPVTSSDAAGTAESARPDASASPEGMAPRLMTVYKSPTCGCCTAWVSYMEEEGFATRTVETDQVDPIKAEHGLHAAELKSCHTALIGGYVIEGHVPADDVRRLLSERPDVVGLSAPGMPMMSPGMGSREPKDYDVLAFDESGSTTVWSSY